MADPAPLRPIASPEKGQAHRPALSPATRVYIAVLTLTAAALGLWGWALPEGPPPPWSVLLLVLLGVLAVSLRERELGPHLGVSIATVILAAAIPLVGPAGAVLVGYFSYLGDLRSQLLRARLFNAAMVGCLGGLGGLVYHRLGGRTPLDADADLLLRVALPLAAGYVIMTVLNAWIVGFLERLVSGGSTIKAAEGVLRSLGLGYLSHVLIAFLFVVLWVPAGAGAFSAVLILGPLVITQWTLSQHAEERRAHERTVATIVAALEAANPYSVGHSSRVAELCGRMAPRLEVRAEAATELHFAALLHDVGLIAVAPRMRRGSDEVDTDYLVTVAEHPEAGLTMLRDITFLTDALPGILHHHERVDGRGFPAGLAGEEIPLFARIIGVADAFDSLTTTRSHRDAVDQDEALALVLERTGTHLDGEVVQALVKALADNPWEPTVIDGIARASMEAAHDHDDPAVSDLYAQWAPESEATG